MGKAVRFGYYEEEPDLEVVASKFSDSLNVATHVYLLPIRPKGHVAIVLLSPRPVTRLMKCNAEG